jgi:regulator of RNase E activity RraA
MFEYLPPVLGYAATARIRTSEPPMGSHSYYGNTDWWNHILSIPPPRIMVIEDLDQPAGLGGFIAEVQAHILLALDCVGLATNGTVRDLDLIKPTGFAIFAKGVAVSHAFAHIVDFGGKVSIGGLEVQPGDLIHADRHGVHTVPIEIAGAIPPMAQKIMNRKRQLINVCHSADFSLEKLRKAIQETEDFSK